MFIQKVVGNIDGEKTVSKRLEWVELDWEELNKRILRKTTDQGTDVAISLEQEQPLQFGDLIFEDEERQIAVRTKLEEVIVIRPKTITEMGKAAFELGNRHTPCLIDESEIIVRYDHTLGKLLDEVGVGYERSERRFKQPFKYRGHQH
ncbi:urease accessory protein UreE [Halobacillus shinanisalinarum]|uniref:Urease accessory protein UreE n=1 Tax=Halobacillus shinanisalinarum TaxID=2932258 RepID=A0ABY4H3H1_9BACI|nr:urease accessory protein UreE [Halobacillus shinanisalinarum]UOQ94746.1 urease accessory protein UreE [Halobacillus shinanisalinarum]